MITLKTLPDATAQEVFDQCARHLLAQKKRSAKDGSCVYRGPGGLKCAAGCFIADDEYSEDMETNRWGDLLLEGRVPSAHSDLIVNLQCVHDCYTPDQWRSRLRYVAKQSNLSTAVLEELKP